MDVPQLIIDLAIMLTTAAVVTIVFKKLNIPTILGYIVAGFLIGPHFPLFLDIGSTESVETWSEIGVVIILFHIGLEFDFHKISDIGSTAIVSALVKMSGVLFVGYGFGLFLGMSTMDSVFLGVMLYISSTVVIQKCLEEMDLAGEKFAGLVMGSLVMEDVIAVFMMVILTTMSASQSGSSGSTALHLALMLVYLVIWLVLGIYFVPTFLDKVMDLMNNETLVLLSLGFCFLMALLANSLGFSMELGAFLAGSFFAGTRHVHRIEAVTAGIKDMFGSIFFLSVGMLVDPEIIATKWTSIVPIAIIAVVAKLVFATIGMVFSGQDLDTAVRGGVSLAPIGEFSFIIAALGISLGVMDEYLYPVIVASSILTIMFTPVMIRQSDRIVAAFTAILPQKLRLIIDNYTSDDRDDEEHTSEWKIVIKDFLVQIAVYGSIMLVTVLAGCNLLQPALERISGSASSGASASRIITAVLIYAVIIVFTRPFMGRRSVSFTQLWMDSLTNRPPLVAMVAAKILILIVLAVIPIIELFSIRNGLVLLIIPAAVYVFARSEFIATYYLQLETRFFANLNQKTMEERGGSRETQHWLEEDFSIFSWHVPNGASYAERSIKELGWGRVAGVYVVKVRRGERRFTIPEARFVLLEDDKVFVIGDRQSLETFYKTLEIEDKVHMRTLKEFLDEGYEGTDSENYELSCAAIRVRGTEGFAGKPIKKSGINQRVQCMILGIERDRYATRMPDANMLIEKDDILWIIGSRNSVGRIAAHSVGRAGTHRSHSQIAAEEAAEIRERM